MKSLLILKKNFIYLLSAYLFQSKGKFTFQFVFFKHQLNIYILILYLYALILHSTVYELSSVQLICELQKKKLLTLEKWRLKNLLYLQSTTPNGKALERITRLSQPCMLRYNFKLVFSDKGRGRKTF